MSSSKKKANGAKEKPTKYDITIKYTDKDMPFILEEMTHRSNKDINNNTGARLSKLINKEYENIATSEDILVSVNKTVVLKLSLPKIKRMFHGLAFSLLATSSSKTEDDNRLYLLNNKESFHCIYNAMKNYADIEEIQRCCIVTVCTMMDIKESHEAIQNSLIEEMISLAMENFPNNKNIQEY